MEPNNTTSKLTAFDFRRIMHGVPVMHDPGLQFAAEHLYHQRELPKLEDLFAFGCWQYSQAQAALGTDPTIMEIVEGVQSTHYNDPMAVDFLMKQLQCPRLVHIPLGEYRGFGYRLRPYPCPLRATPAPPMQVIDTRTLLPGEFLGLNKLSGLEATEGMIGAPRKDSILSNAPLDDATGFVFFQLGVLEYADHQQWAQQASGLLPHDMVWLPTNYAVVVRIDKESRSQDVWIICNYSKAGHVSLNPSTPNKNGEKRGRDLLPSDNAYGKRRPAARIAKCFRDLVLLPSNNLIMLDLGSADVLENFELVAAVLHGEGDDSVIIRQYVRPETKRKSPVLESDSLENENARPTKKAATDNNMEQERKLPERKKSEIKVPGTSIEEAVDEWTTEVWEKV